MGNRERPAGYWWERERRHRLKQWGLTEESYEKLVKKQKGLCLGCGQTQEKRLGVYFDRVTQRVAGLFCSRCCGYLANIRRGCFIPSYLQQWVPRGK